METVSTHQIVTAALLHDIGKFMWRANIRHSPRHESLTQEDYGWNGAHSKLSADFVSSYINDKKIEDLVLYHHNPRKSGNQKYAEIIQKADHLSSAMDRSERSDEGKVREEPLKSIFPEIKGPYENKNTVDMYYHLEVQGIGERSFPVRRDQIKYHTLSGPYSKLWDAFSDEFASINKDIPVGTLLSLLKKYTSKIPSAVYKNEPDIPLFDHAKTTAAIAQCLAESENPTHQFLLVQGNLSGIQDFIFNVASPDVARKGMAKRLRGRSFWLTLCMDAVTQEIKNLLGLYEPSILWNTGGNFLILVPNTKQNMDKIGIINRQVNQGMLNSLGGGLSLNIGMLECTSEDIRKFSDTLEKLHSKTAEAKKQKFLECQVPFLPSDEENLPIERYCPICGAVRRSDAVTCTLCEDHIRIGTRLASAKYLLRGDSKDQLPISFSAFGLNAAYRFIDKEPDNIYETGIFTINSTKFPVAGPHDSGYIFIGNTVPKNRGHILSFGEISQLSGGTSKLGLIKADVDNLGYIFSKGIPEENDKRSISRIHTLSDSIAFFFTGELNRICSEFAVYSHLCDDCQKDKVEISVTEINEESGEERSTIYYEHPSPCENCRKKYSIPKFYITYSGGDDLFIVGPWDASLELAERIYSEFRKFTCENPNITLSAGLEIVSPRFPLSRAVNLAEKQLETSKTIDARKDRIAVFDECLRWRGNDYEKDFNTVFSAAKTLEKFVKHDRIVSKSMVYSLLTLWKQTFGATENLDHGEAVSQRTKVKRFLPNLKYMLKRNIREKDSRDKVEGLVVPLFPWIKIPVYWTSMRLRN